MYARTPETITPEYRKASRGGIVIATAVLFIVLPMGLTILRAWSRRLQQAPFMAADVLVPAGLAFVIATCVVSIISVQYGSMGRHTLVALVYYPESITVSLKIVFFVMPCLYCVAVTLPKLAILDLYLLLFQDRTSTWATYIVCLITILAAVVNLFTTLFQCRPFDHLWNPHPGGHCLDTIAHFQWASFPNIFTDFAMLLIPLPTLAKLRVPMRIKIGVILMFLTGSIGLAASIARFVSFTHTQSTTEDPYWEAVPLVVWTIAEPGIYTIAACLVTLKPLLNYVVRDSCLAPLFTRTSSPLPRGKKAGAVPLGSSDSAQAVEPKTRLNISRPIQINPQNAQYHAV